jgi:hypothetical protein
LSELAWKWHKRIIPLQLILKLPYFGFESSRRRKIEQNLEVTNNLFTFATEYSSFNNVNMKTTKRKRTREEVRAAFKEALRRKQEWIEESNAFLERIHQQRLAEQI